jgi:uncharacterized protein Yka (UPF0111/DUF47 family)
MNQHEDLQELLARLNNVRDSIEEASGYVRGIKGAIREISEQITELVSARRR